MLFHWAHFNEGRSFEDEIDHSYFYIIGEKARIFNIKSVNWADLVSLKKVNAKRRQLTNTPYPLNIRDIFAPDAP